MTAMAPTRFNCPANSSNPLPVDNGSASANPDRFLFGMARAGSPLLLPISGRRCGVPIMADLAAPAAARSVVDEAIRTWHVPVDPEIAVLLTSELVANAVTHGARHTNNQAGQATQATTTQAAGQFILLTLACDAAGLRVEVHDGSDDLPVADATLLDIPAEAKADAESGRGLLLVAALSNEWCFYRTPTGKAVFFTMRLQPTIEAVDAVDAVGTIGAVGAVKPRDLPRFD